jgi:diguanylate cyclase (GGDEF)-like protein/PAS domain S-box-containing protein
MIARMSSTPPLPHDKLLDMLLDVVCVVDIEGRFLSVSAASEQVFGFRPEEMVGRTAFELMHPEDREANLAVIKHINSGSPSIDHENRYIHKDGSIVHVMWTAQWLETEQVRVGVARDITARKRAEAVQSALYNVSEAAHRAADLNELYAQVHEIVGQLICADNFFVALYDPTSDEISFPYHVDQVASHPPTQPLEANELCAQMIRTGEALLLTPQSTTPPRDWLGVPLVAGKETIGALVLQNYSGDLRYTQYDMELIQFMANQLADAIERKRTQSRLEYLAQYDQLTELPNRALFLDHLGIAVKRSQRGNLRLAVMYLDMDDFKLVNDTFGHGMGDMLLHEVAKRLCLCVRDSDTVGRLGGDEFAILLENITKQEDAVLVAEKVLAALSAPYLLDGQTLISTPSLGIAVYPEHSRDEQHLVRLADEAMYTAKRAGGQRYCLAG